MNSVGGYERYGNIIINKNQSLGSGQYGHVWKGYLIEQNKSLQTVAIKQSFQQFESNRKQIQTLKILEHPNIIKYIDYKIAEKTVFIVMELCEGGTLDNLLYSMEIYEPQKLINYYSQIVEGIKFMYNKKILHRDLKPQNILISHNTIKIADFGQSKMNSSNTLKTLAGTPLFASPELLEVLEGEKQTYTEKSQIWSLGLILYFMFNYSKQSLKSQQRMRESVPWAGRSYGQLLLNIKNKPLTFKRPGIPQQIKQIIKKMLAVNASERMSFQQFFQLKIFQIEETTTAQSHNLKAREKTINEISQQEIDWELQELIQMKVHENTAILENEECRQFYEMILEEFSEVYEIQYYELMYELEHQYYQITNRPEERTRILQKYFERQQNFHIFSPMEESVLQNQSEMIKNQSGILLDHKPQIEHVMPLPSEKLTSQCKKFINDKISEILQISSPKKKKSSFQDDMKYLLFTIYDFFTLLTFSKSWEIKRKFKITVADYKKARRAVSLDKIIGRIRLAVQSVQI